MDVTPRIAIIGAGAGGSSAAFYLSEHLQVAEVTIFEASGYVGGRAHTINALNDSRYPVEIGASIFVEANRNLVSAAELFDLELIKNSPNLGGLDESLGMYLRSELSTLHSSM